MAVRRSLARVAVLCTTATASSGSGATSAPSCGRWQLDVRPRRADRRATCADGQLRARCAAHPELRRRGRRRQRPPGPPHGGGNLCARHRLHDPRGAPLQRGRPELREPRLPVDQSAFGSSSKSDVLIATSPGHNDRTAPRAIAQVPIESLRLIGESRRSQLLKPLTTHGNAIGCRCHTRVSDYRRLQSYARRAGPTISISSRSSGRTRPCPRMKVP